MADRHEPPAIILGRVRDYMLASLIRQTLEGEGIPCFTDGDNFNAVGAGLAGSFADIRVYVRQCDCVRAIEILSRMIPPNTLPGEPRCPKCEYILYYAKDQRCPECGRPFKLAEIGMQEAEFVDGVLRPRSN